MVHNALPDPSEHTMSLDILGANLADVGSAEHYAKMRQLAAANVIGMLAAQSEEYNRRQGGLNWGFLERIGHIMPVPTLSAEITWGPVTESRSYHTRACTVRSLSSHYKFDTHDTPIAEIDEELLEDIVAVRAATIWLPRKLQEVYKIGTPELANRSYSQRGMAVDPTVKAETVVLPHVQVGHKEIDDKHTEVLLLPLDESPTYFHSPKQHWAGSSFVTFNQLPHVLRASMTTRQYHNLFALQEVLIGEALSLEDVEASYNDQKGNFTLDTATMPIVRGELHTSRQHFGERKSGPQSITGMRSRHFDFRHKGLLSDSISPDDFYSYRVMADSQRSADMLNKSEWFKKIREDFVDRSYTNPELSLLDK